MKTLSCLCGSQRRDSLNRRLLEDVAARLSGQCHLDMLTNADVDLPVFNQDLERRPELVARASALHARLAASDGIIVASPEYNGLPTPYLTNLVAWVSRLEHVDLRFGNPFRGKPLLLCSASTGHSGGALAVPHARALFEYVGCAVADEVLCVPYADRVSDCDGFNFDPLFDAEVDEVVERFLRRVETSGANCPDALAAS